MRRMTAVDLRRLGRTDIDPELVTIEIDPEDLDPPSFDRVSIPEAMAHWRALREKYFGGGAEQLLAPSNQAAIYALLEHNLHPEMRAKHEAQRAR